MSHNPPGWVLAALALGVISFAFSPILVRLASEGPGLAIAVWRTGLAALMLTPFAIRTAGKEIRTMDGREIMLIVLSGVFLGFHFIAWIESLYHTSVASASVLVTTSPLFLAIAGFMLLGERISRPITFAIVGAVMGASLLGWSDVFGNGIGPRPLLGNSLALLAALLVTGYLLIGRVIRRNTSWLAYVWPLYTISAVTAIIVALIQDVPLFGYSASFYAWCLVMALGPQIIGHGSFNYALHFIPAALVGVLALFEPVGAAILAYILFGEVPSTLAVVGMAVVICSLAIIIRQRTKNRNIETEGGSTIRGDSGR